MFISIKKSIRTRIPELFKVRDAECLGCPCFKPGVAKLNKDERLFHAELYQRRKKEEPIKLKVCLNMISPKGCPETEYSEELKTERINKMWGTTAL
jgi:hypothetical protein